MILALETATAACSAALVAPDGELIAERIELRGPAHTRVLLRQAHEVLEEAGVAAADVETVVVGLGPGAFTGLRIGVATARGLALAGATRLGGVPTLTALALALSGAVGGEASRRLLPLIDARRREVFAACYERASHEREAVERADDGRAGVERASDGPGVRDARRVRGAPAVRARTALAVVPADELGAYLEQFPGAVVGGDGAVLYAERVPRTLTVATAVVAPTAAMVAHAWLADVADRREGAAAVVPVYGREPDAVRWHERRPS